MKLILYWIIFLCNLSFACDQGLIDSSGKELIKKEEILKHYVTYSSLILWLKVEKSISGLTIFKVREVIKGNYSGKYFATDGIKVSGKKENKDFNGHKNLESRYSLGIDCSYPELTVSTDASYIYFVGSKFNHMLEQVEVANDLFYKFIKSNIK